VTRIVWIDASAGIAGDMLLGALVDLGIPIETLQQAVDAVLPGSARMTASTVLRAGLRAVKVEVAVTDDQPARTWTDIRRLLDVADLPTVVAGPAQLTFERLADAEARIHGVPPDEVHFHEVGAVDAIADVVGACAGLAALGVDDVVLSPVALGSGSVRAAHGVLPIPPPAVLELVRGWAVAPAPPDAGELATPTGVALATTLARSSGGLPAMTVGDVGVGAGTRDRDDRANVVRLVVGEHSEEAEPAAGAVVLETNVDDLDLRVWPDVLARVLDAGALDAWLTPILMKKGRPGHTLHVLAGPADEGTLTELVLTHTSTLGVRRTPVTRSVLDRSWVPVEVLGGKVGIKVASREGRVVHAAPEYEEAAALAGTTGVPVAHVLTLAAGAAVAAGLVPGASVPPPQ
jgi:pyridinium-3,5-bisthiocarboxylic acid mononucleotide nickel chelatase